MTCAIRSPFAAQMLALQGPEIRTSYLVDSRESRQRIPSLDLKTGDQVQIYGTDQIEEDTFIGYRKADGTVVLGVDLVDFVDVVTPDTIIRLRDGAIGIKITGVTSDGARATGVVLNAGSLGDRRVVHISGVVLHASPTSTRNDMQDIQDFAIEHGVDYIAASQVSGRHDIEALRSFLVANGLPTIKIIAKIETAEGLRNLDDIIDESDGIMVSRNGDEGRRTHPSDTDVAPAAGPRQPGHVHPS
jgi:pyruvate kinase